MSGSVTGLVGPSVTGEVEKDHGVPHIGEIGGESAVHLSVEEQAVEEHQHVRAFAVAFIVQSVRADTEAPFLERSTLEKRSHSRNWGKEQVDGPGYALSREIDCGCSGDRI
jgi:hypothetical protein